MGPRRIRRGELSGLLYFTEEVWASMGPRRIRRGEARDGGNHRATLPSFNGATANSPWRTLQKLNADAANEAALQWGHGEFAVENGKPRTGGDKTFGLQWGHGEFAVEN